MRFPWPPVHHLFTRWPLLGVLFECHDSVILRHILYLKFRDFLMQLRVLRLQLSDVMLDRRLARLECRFQVGRFTQFAPPNVPGQRLVR